MSTTRLVRSMIIAGVAAGVVLAFVASTAAANSHQDRHRAKAASLNLVGKQSGFMSCPLASCAISSTAYSFGVKARAIVPPPPIINPGGPIITRVGPGSHRHKTGTKHQKPAKPLPVKLSIAVGFYSQFRAGALVPIRITAHNKSSATVAGLLEIPDLSSAYNAYADKAVYQEPLTLPANATKHLTMYLPAGSVAGTLNVRMDVHGQPVGDTSQYTSTFQRGAITVGILTTDPTNEQWVKRLQNANAPGEGKWLTPVQLTPTTFDPVAAALANFDLIVIGDGTVSSLDTAQLNALQQYVTQGGSLLEVGGPAWQQTLKPLPAGLVPGTVSGVTSVSDLSGLSTITASRSTAPQGSAAVSTLSSPTGTVLATQNGVPLVVSDPVGLGHVTYLAFDPNLSPFPGWSGAMATLSAVLDDAAPSAAARPESGFGYGVFPGGVIPYRYGYMNGPASEVDNVPSPALPLSIGFVILAGFFVLLIGPFNFLLFGRLRRRAFLWMTIPIGALLCTGATFGVAGAMRDQSVLVNTMSVVTLGASSTSHPDTTYMGLFAPIPGTYRMTVNQPGYAQSVSQSLYAQYAYQFRGPRSGSQSSPSWLSHAGIRFQEGATTQILFQKMDTWSMRNAEISTNVNIPGRIQSDLHVGRDGYITGWVRNTTNLRLISPTIVAGRRWVSLPTMNPGQRVRVTIRPDLDIYNNATKNETIWQRIFGSVRWNSPVNNSGGLCFGKCLPSGWLGGGPSPGCYGPFGSCGPTVEYPKEHSFLARLRNVANLLPEASNVSSLGEMLFIAWNQKSLLPITVNGGQPTTRNLNMIVQPISPSSISSGPFKIRTGTFAAKLVAVRPVKSNRNYYDQYGSGLDFGGGGSATYAFQLPSGKSLRFKQLGLYCDAGGANSVNMGNAWDWQDHRWVNFDLVTGYANLTNPNRFVSSTGSILVKLYNTDYTRDLEIVDSNRQLQIAGSGVAG